MKVYSDVLRNFMKDDDNPTFLLVGPSGSGKRLHTNNIFTNYNMEAFDI